MKNAFLHIAMIIFFAVVVFLFFKLILTLALVAFIAALIWTWSVQKDGRNKIFLVGTLPNPAPDGPYQGIFLGHHTSWRGKKFFAQSATGINVFSDKSGQTTERYPFKTYTGKGLQDKHLEVMKIDYNVEQNPFWLKLIVDEIVQIAPNEYLGKMHLSLIPGLPFTILYFELKK